MFNRFALTDGERQALTNEHVRHPDEIEATRKVSLSPVLLWIFHIAAFVFDLGDAEYEKPMSSWQAALDACRMPRGWFYAPTLAAICVSTRAITKLPQVHHIERQTRAQCLTPPSVSPSTDSRLPHFVRPSYSCYQWEQRGRSFRASSCSRYEVPTTAQAKLGKRPDFLTGVGGRHASQQQQPR
jgi:hypothetical protein